jgi:hypothetical protein
LSAATAKSGLSSRDTLAAVGIYGELRLELKRLDHAPCNRLSSPVTRRGKRRGTKQPPRMGYLVFRFDSRARGMTRFGVQRAKRKRSRCEYRVNKKEQLSVSEKVRELNHAADVEH